MGSDDRGLRCAKCGCGHFSVIRTVAAPRNRVQRTRECRNCGRNLVTYEAAAGEALTPALDDLTPQQRESLLEKLLHLFGMR